MMMVQYAPSKAAYLEDHPRPCKWLIIMVIVSPLTGVVGPLPNGRTSWLINGDSRDYLLNGMILQVDSHHFMATASSRCLFRPWPATSEQRRRRQGSPRCRVCCWRLWRWKMEEPRRFFFFQIFGRVRSSEIRPRKKGWGLPFWLQKNSWLVWIGIRFSDVRRQFSCRFCGHHFWGLFFCSLSLPQKNNESWFIPNLFIHVLPLFGLIGLQYFPIIKQFVGIQV